MPLQLGCYDEVPYYQENERDEIQTKPSSERIESLFNETGPDSVIELGGEFKCKNCGRKYDRGADAFGCCFWENYHEQNG